MEGKRLCCFMYSETLRCQNEALWEVWKYGSSNPDDYTDACMDHLGELLTDAPIHVVYNIPTEGEV